MHDSKRLAYLIHEDGGKNVFFVKIYWLLMHIVCVVVCD